MLQNQIFRKQALERLSRPEQLDQLLTVVGARLWIPMIVLLGLASGAIAWSIYGRIPVNVDGPGVLVNPNHIKPIFATSSGEIAKLSIQMDSIISSGQVIAELKQPELLQRVAHAEERLNQAIRQHEQQEADDRKFAGQERELISRQVKLLEDSITQFRDLFERAGAGNEAYESQQMAGLDTAAVLVRKLNHQLAEKQTSLVELDQQRLIPRDLRLSADAEMIESTLRLADIDLQKSSLDLQRLQTRQLQLQQQSQINELNLELKRLLLRVEEIERQTSENIALHQRERLQLQQEWSELQATLERSRWLRSEFDGRVIEVSSFVGQRLMPMTRVASIEIFDALPAEATDPSRVTLQCVAYLPLQSGKKVEIGVPVHVTPTTVQRSRFGSLVGTVTRVSEFPVSQEAAINTLGSSQILADLSQASALLEIVVELKADETVSGYRWTTRGGPPVRLTSGTTAMSSFTVDQRAPITYVLPLLRSLFFGGESQTTPGGKGEPL